MSYKKIIFIISFLAVFGLMFTPLEIAGPWQTNKESESLTGFNFNAPTIQAMTIGEIQALIHQLQQQINQLQQQLQGLRDEVPRPYPFEWGWEACTPERPCTVGQGDCDRDADCAPGLFCAQNVGAKYGQHPLMDVCERKIPEAKNEAKNYDMLIFISPQYKNDSKIETAINNYIAAVKKDIGWDTKVIRISSEKNDFRKIDNIIEDYYEAGSSKLKAVIMVGEDIHTALSADIWGQEAPSTIPWATIGRETAYTIVGGDEILSRHYLISIAVSLIYPTHDQDYETKSSQIVSVFERFSKNRNKVYPKKIAAFYDPALSPEKTRQIFQKLGQYGELELKENPSLTELTESLGKRYRMYNVSGHGTPMSTSLGRTGFSAEHLRNLKTPLFTATGCYNSGWFTGPSNDNQVLDFSISRRNRWWSWYGANIFTNPNLRLLALGLPAQIAHWDTHGNFITNIAPGLKPNWERGKTIAELMIGHKYYGETILYGDPTFHFHPPACEPLLEGIRANLMTRCGDANYNPVFDLNKDKIINISDFGLIVANQDNEAWCREKKACRIDPCIVAPTCEYLLKGIQDNFTARCGHVNYNLIFDLNKDKIINIKDLDLVEIKQDNEAWCREKKACRIDPCIITPTCLYLLRGIQDNFMTQCGDANYNPVFDLNKDRIINSADFSLLVVNQDNEAWCGRKKTSGIDPCIITPTCLYLLRGIQDSFMARCGDANYNLVFDLDNDRIIYISDLNLLARNQGNEAWCREKKACTIDPCLPAPTCEYLLRGIQDNFMAQCGDANYNPVFDINNDKVINLTDFDLVRSNYFEAWCREKKACRIDPCLPAPTCEYLLRGIQDNFMAQCGDANYNPVFDINKDKIINISDFGLIVANQDNETWCKNMKAATEDPCRVGLRNIRNQLASISEAVSRLIESMKRFLER